MAATDQTYRNQHTLDIVFAVSRMLMLVSIVWMFWQDYFRAYKVEQRDFRDVEVAVAQQHGPAAVAGQERIQRPEAKVDNGSRSVQDNARRSRSKSRRDDVREAEEEAEGRRRLSRTSRRSYDSNISFLRHRGPRAHDRTATEIPTEGIWTADTTSSQGAKAKVNDDLRRTSRSCSKSRSTQHRRRRSPRPSAEWKKLNDRLRHPGEAGPSTSSGARRLVRDCR